MMCCALQETNLAAKVNPGVKATTYFHWRPRGCPLSLLNLFFPSSVPPLLRKLATRKRLSPLVQLGLKSSKSDVRGRCVAWGFLRKMPSCCVCVCVCGGRKKMLTNLYGACGVVSFIIICELFNIFIANDNQIGNWRVFDERRLKCRFWVFVRSKGGGITRVACKFFFIEQWRLQRWLF